MSRRFACKNMGNTKCDYAVESEQKKELVKSAKMHLNEKHGKGVSEEEIIDASETLKHKKAVEEGSGGVGP